MRKFIGVIVLSFFSIVYVNAQEITGVWKTIDDETGDAKSHVTIYEEDGKYYGTITKILAEDRQDAVCDKCSGSLKDQPILGMQIINGIKKVKDKKFAGGSILDPKKGKTYKLAIYDQGDKLKVRGFIGFEGAGRTQYWYKVK